MRKTIAVLILALASITISTPACNKQPAVAVHPGAINNYDSYAYDVLLVEQDALNESRAQYVAGNLPAEAKGPLNIAITQYNTAEALWKTYHAGSTANLAALQQAITDLVTAVGTLSTVLGKPAPKPISNPTSAVRDLFNLAPIPGV